MECPKCKGQKLLSTTYCEGKGTCEGWFDHDCPGKPHVNAKCSCGHKFTEQAKAEEKPKD